MARADIAEGQGLWQPGGAEEDSRFREGDRHLRLGYDEEEEASCSKNRVVFAVLLLTPMILQ